MKRRIFSIILAICMMIPVICALPFTSSAVSLTSGIYTYTVSSDQVIITKCSSSAGGNITIPSQIDGKTVIGIGSSAFKDCDSITSVSIPSTVKKLGVKAFYGCDSLSTLTLSNGVEEIGIDCFRLCTGLKTLTIPDSVTYMGSDAFYGCTRLTSVVIGNGITEINDSCFNGCSVLF